MRIRRGILKDLPALLAVDELARADDKRKRWLRDAIKQRSVYVLCERHVPVAYGVLTRNFFHRSFIEMLYVAKDERRKGYGAALLAGLETAGMRAGEVWTSTNQSNRPMRQLLKKQGFAMRGKVTGLDEGDPEVFYQKRGL